jgi:hypothetical protein
MTTKNPQLSGFNVFILHLIGGAGGNRTPVRKPSTDSSTYLAVLFDLTYSAPTSKQEISELP